MMPEKICIEARNQKIIACINDGELEIKTLVIMTLVIMTVINYSRRELQA